MSLDLVQEVRGQGLPSRLGSARVQPQIPLPSIHELCHRGKQGHSLCQG